jgi:triosephosphate isomerase
MSKTLIAGNWKMNGSLAANAELWQALSAGLPAVAAPGVEIALCAPALYLAQLQALLAGSAVALGAQDVSAHAAGAYTGEVSATMLQDFAVRYVIVGHSERRQYHGESDAVVAAKARAAVDAGLTPIVCVGETLAEREAGATQSVVSAQLQAVIEVLGADLVRAVVAYEPVWAIGTGRTASPQQAQDVHAALRRQLVAADAAAQTLPLLYGGSMNAGNAAELLAQPDVNGGLIGGASLKPADFLKIIDSAR